MWFSIISILVCSFLSFAGTGSKCIIGTTESILDDLHNNRVKTSSNYFFTVPNEEKIPVVIRSFYFEDGELSMQGEVQGRSHSEFILKGNVQNLYGWIVLKNKNRAYEYTTDENKHVTVEQVLISQVFSVQDYEVPEGVTFTAITADEAENTTFFPYKNTSNLPPHIGKYPGSNVNKLQSLPGAAKVMFLDIADMMAGETPKNQTKEDIWWTWQCVAGAYSAYTINVTTDRDVYQKAGVTNAGICRFIDTIGRSSSGLNIFGTTSAARCFRDRSLNDHPKGGYSTGRTAWHESGHIMGVRDYGGTPGGTYFEGFPRYKWVPIMGNYWFSDWGKWGNKTLQQWSKGEYATANCTQDFLKIANKHLPYRDDDIPTSKPIQYSGVSKVSPDINFGQICPSTDSDEFTFDIKGTKGQAHLMIDRIEYLGGAMLDVDASIVDASGKVMVQHNADSARFAKLDIELKKGTYKIIIKAGAEGTPKKGFSTYGSIGFYGISGEILDEGTDMAMQTKIHTFFRISPMSIGKKIHITYPTHQNSVSISLFSLNGTRLFHTNQSLHCIDFSGVTSGLYTMRVLINGVRVNRKIIIN